MPRSDSAGIKRAPRSEGLSDEELRRFLNAFYRWRENAQGPGQQCSRSRVLFLCLLIRYAGLRLGEALAFDDREDMLPLGSRIRVRGKWARELPMPPSAMKKLEELCDAPCLARERGRIAMLDQGYVRRLFEQRAQEAGLDSPMSPSTLRRYREAELLRNGVPLPLVERYLGRQGRRSGIDDDDMALLQNSFRRWESERRIGRYNIFRGRVERMEQGDFSSRFVVAAQSGQRVHARCSNRTAARFGLGEGAEVTVRVRMLSIAVDEGGTGGAEGAEGAGPMNVFTGIMRALHTGKDEVKATFELSGGERLSSILSRAAFEKLAIAEGDAVQLRIAPENVMLASGGE
ncbi:TOBE domain-containing protein [Mailhella sp.]|uniref:TOBE domain-containing protein n=1 Tax=Mailhella sp. TaxID=1981029 RepID=UPI0040646C78